MEESDIHLSVLCLEDSLKDAELLQEQLVDGGYQISMEIAKSKKEFTDFLENNNYNLILADNSIPQFDASAALKVSLSLKPEIPFICVSGTVGEEKAVELLKQGASDYVIKDRLERLFFSVKRALKERELEKKHKQTEESLKNTFHISPSIIAKANLNTGFYIEVNHAVTRILGYSIEEFTSTPIIEMLVPDDIHSTTDAISEQQKGKELTHFENRFFCKDGTIKWIEWNASPSDDKGIVIGVGSDITERKQADLELIKTKELSFENEAKFRELFSSVSDAIFSYNPYNYEIIEANKATSVLYGYSHDELIGMSCLLFSAEVESSKAIAKSIMTNKIITVKERHHKKKDGTDLIIEINNYNISVNGKNIYYSVCHDITDIKKKELELIKAKEQAEESDRLKSAFLANMSHEIRTPMNGILGFAELLETTNVTPENQQKYIKIILESGQRMLTTINNIVDISKIEVGLMKVNRTLTNINEHMEFHYKFFTSMTDSKGLQLSFHECLPSNEAIIETDTQMLNSILTNLIKNAIKFTDKGSIEIGYKKLGGFLEFFVKDTGIGIPKDRQEAVFERFIQADMRDKRAFQGSGLGLSISQKYVEMIGGKIWVDSEQGKGSTFYFTLPYEPLSANNEVSEDVISEKNEIPGKKNLKILLAEDDETSSILINEVLKKINPEIIHVETGVEAIEACRDNPDLDLILMDIKMPVMDGYEATKNIRKFNKEVIIIAQTAHAFSVTSEIARDTGCNDYISKPINGKTLLELIKKHCNRSLEKPEH